MAGGVNTSVIRRAKTATVRTVVPKLYRDVAAGAQLYGHALNAEQRGHTEVAERMKLKAGQWAQGNRVDPGSTGNFTGNNSTRRLPNEMPQRIPGQRTADTSASVSRNAAVVEKGVSKIPTIAESVMADIARAAPKALNVIGKMAVPLTVAAAGGEAVYQGVKRYQNGEGIEGAVSGAAWGAADSISLGLFNWAMGRNSDGTKNMPSGPAGSKDSPRQMTPGQQKTFSNANQRFETRRAAQGDADQGNGNHNRGTRNESNLKAIIAARQARAAGDS